MVGISYWNDNDGHRLSQDIPDVYTVLGVKSVIGSRCRWFIRKIIIGHRVYDAVHIVLSQVQKPLVIVAVSLGIMYLIGYI